LKEKATQGWRKLNKQEPNYYTPHQILLLRSNEERCGVEAYIILGREEKNVQGFRWQV